ncbi:MAG TPA: pyruvate dehydrogenase (acetyl-transferring) E1 component subunit alpha [Pseudomonadales bacterium]
MLATINNNPFSKTVAQFNIAYTQMINHLGEAVAHLDPDIANEKLLTDLYKSMVFIRLFDKKAVALQRTGKMGTYPSSLGQEAVGVGIGYAMNPNDVFAPYYRDHAALYLRGVSLADMLLYWGGDERGSLINGAPQFDLPNCVPIANQITHAAGIACAIKIRHEKNAVLTTCGDGATSRGDFYEAINLAGIWQLPMVVVVNNNQWAISVSRGIQTAAETIAQKAIAAGMPGEQVDGNDALAVYSVIKKALKKARAGKGPTLIEAITYRLGDHTTADDATRYRPPEALNKGWELEPIKRLQTFLHNNNFWGPEQERAWITQCEQNITQGVEAYLNTPDAPPEDIFDYLYAELPFAMEEQRQHLIAKARSLNANKKEEESL